MKNITILLLFLGTASFAQTKLDKSIPAKAGQQVRLTFDYPELVRVSTWDRNDIGVQGTVSINGGENDEAFVLDVNTSGNVIDIRGRIKDMDDLPHRITVVKDGITTTFRNESEWQKYRKEHGKSGYDMMNRGLDMDIILDIKVPVKMATTVVSVYGMVEVKQFNGPLSVEATYGGVDASLTEGSIGELIAETNYGHIYSDLATTFNSDKVREEDFHTIVSAKPGNGPAYRFESPYGNVYLRRTK